jgi:hypothetical protein
MIAGSTRMKDVYALFGSSSSCRYTIAPNDHGRVLAVTLRYGLRKIGVADGGDNGLWLQFDGRSGRLIEATISDERQTGFHLELQAGP